MIAGEVPHPFFRPQLSLSAASNQIKGALAGQAATTTPFAGLLRSSYPVSISLHNLLNLFRLATMLYNNLIRNARVGAGATPRYPLQKQKTVVDRTMQARMDAVGRGDMGLLETNVVGDRMVRALFVRQPTTQAEAARWMYLSPLTGKLRDACMINGTVYRTNVPCSEFPIKLLKDEFQLDITTGTLRPLPVRPVRNLTVVRGMPTVSGSRAHFTRK